VAHQILNYGDIMISKRLYKRTSVGQIQYWEIEVQGAKIITRYGKEGGKEMVSEDIVKEAKSQDTIEKQAQAEAESQWKGKIKKGYVEEIGRAASGETNHDGGWFPMLAHKFSEQGYKIVYPAYVQPKLDGYRCVSDGTGHLWTRTRKPYVSVPHIEKALLKGVKLDGELYNHAYRAEFEKISHLVNQKTEPAKGHEIVQYHVFDVNMPGSFEKRYAWLKKNLPVGVESPFVLVETIKVSSEEELMEAFDNFLAQGYEGAIVRNGEAPYQEKRSYDLQKIKSQDDAEFKIIGVVEGRGKLQGSAIFICETLEGVSFQVKLRGPLSALKKFFEDKETWQGKQLTVKYQGFTNKNRVPRFPVGVRIREDA